MMAPVPALAVAALVVALAAVGAGKGVPVDTQTRYLSLLVYYDSAVVVNDEAALFAEMEGYVADAQAMITDAEFTPPLELVLLTQEVLSSEPWGNVFDDSTGELDGNSIFNLGDWAWEEGNVDAERYDMVVVVTGFEAEFSATLANRDTMCMTRTGAAGMVLSEQLLGATLMRLIGIVLGINRSPISCDEGTVLGSILIPNGGLAACHADNWANFIASDRYQNGNSFSIAQCLDDVPTLCGNGKIEPPEECDGEVCCNDECRLRDSSFSCRLADGPCVSDTFCDGAAANCPAAPHVANNTVCADYGLCRDGVCLTQESHCIGRGFEGVCDVIVADDICADFQCLDNPTFGTCLGIEAPLGLPCQVNGTRAVAYCSQGECVPIVDGGSNFIDNTPDDDDDGDDDDDDDDDTSGDGGGVQIMVLILGSLAVLAIVTYAVALKMSPRGSASAVVLVFVSLGDTVSDVFFALSLYDKGEKELAVYSAAFILGPIIVSLCVVLRFVRVQVRSDKMFQYFSDHTVGASLLSLLAVTNLDLLSLQASRLFGASLFSAPWSVGTRWQVGTYSLITTFGEDVPQLALQVMAALTIDGLGAPVAIAMAFTVSGILLAVMRKGTMFMLKSEHQRRLKNGEEIDDEGLDAAAAPPGGVVGLGVLGGGAAGAAVL